jgi:hypothetical protein
MSSVIHSGQSESPDSIKPAFSALSVSKHGLNHPVVSVESLSKENESQMVILGYKHFN